MGYVIGIIIVLAIIAGVSAAMGFFLMLLWNYVAAGVFHAPSLTFPQAWAGLFLLGLLLGAVRRKE